MHSSENWDHLRYVLAVAEVGSISGAARRLGVNHATVLRHVAAFEAQSGTEVFEKSANGYRVHDDRLRIIEAAREVDTAMQAVRNVARGAKGSVRGSVRVTSTDSFCQQVLPAIVEKWHRQSDELSIELISTNGQLDLSRLDADIVVRPAKSLDKDLHGECAALLAFGVYRTPDCYEDRWLAMGGRLSRTDAAAWLSDNISSDQFVASTDSFMALRELATTGIGAAILPCVIGDKEPSLDRISGIIPELVTNIWVASHADLAEVARIRRVRQMLVSELADMADDLAGLSSG